MFRRLAAAVVLVGGVVGTAYALPNDSTSEFNRVTLTCAPTYRVQVDPIVAPGKQTSAHLHDFYGRIDISNYMFARPPWPPFPGRENDPGYFPLPSSCPNYGDWASYWFPTPRFNGANLARGPLLLTFQSPVGSQVETPPFGMLAIVGNSGATSQAQQEPYVRWTCGDLDGPGSDRPQPCASGRVTAELTFHDCWDGHRQVADTYNYPAGIAPSHFAHSSGGSCPMSHPTRIAQLVERLQFVDPRTGGPLTDPNNADGSLGLSFASGPYYTFHGDFLNTWNIGLEQVYVDRCLNHIGAACPYGEIR